MRRLHLLEIKADTLQFMKVHTRSIAAVNYNELCDSPGPDVALMPQRLRNLKMFIGKKNKKLENFKTSFGCLSLLSHFTQFPIEIQKCNNFIVLSKIKKKVEVLIYM